MLNKVQSLASKTENYFSIKIQRSIVDIRLTSIKNDIKNFKWM